MCSPMNLKIFNHPVCVCAIRNRSVRTYVYAWLSNKIILCFRLIKVCIRRVVQNFQVWGFGFPPSKVIRIRMQNFSFSR